MQAAALGQFSDIGFVFIELKQNYAQLDQELQKEVDRLEKVIQRVCRSRKPPEEEIEELFPVIFSLRVKAIQWMVGREEDLDKVLDDALPEIEVLETNPKLRKIGRNISDSLASNKELMVFLKRSGQLNTDRMRSVGELDYAAFVVAVQYMPTQFRRIISRLSHASLSIEFLSIAAVLLNEKKVEANGPKLMQLSELSYKLSEEYQGLVGTLISFGKKELLTEERNDWMAFGLSGLADAYGDNEPDYSKVEVKEPNPEYTPWKRDRS
jgi:hypothetical protein